MPQANGIVEEESQPGEVLGQIEGFLKEMVQQLEPEAPSERGAPRVLPSMLLWAGLLVCVLRGFRSQLELWRLLTMHGLWSYRFAVTDEAVRKRLASGGTAALRRLFEQVTEVMFVRLLPYAESLASFAQEVLALDETTLDPVARRLPELRKASKTNRVLLPGKLAGLFDVRRQIWRRIDHIENPSQNEKAHARSMVEGLAKGCLILADLGYFGFEWFDELAAMGHHWVSRLRQRTSYEVRHVFYQRGQTLDALIWLGKHRTDRARHSVRLVQFRVGKQVFSYVTSVTDPRVLPLSEVARLYARRWDIEMAVKLVKRELGLHLLWSSKIDLVLQQVWAVLIIAQILQTLRKEIAARAGVDVFDVSMPLMVRTLPQFAADGVDPVRAFVERGRFGGMIRPSRRVKILAPQVPESQIHPLPEGLEMERKPRYNRKWGAPKRI
jgi:Transposase DDE domain